MAIGKLRERVAFETRSLVDDGFGNEQAGDWVEVYRCAARIEPKLGGETVQAQRLTGSQPMLITVRACSKLASLSTAWRVHDVRSDIVYDIRSSNNPDEQRKYLEILAVSGVAT